MLVDLEICIEQLAQLCDGAVGKNEVATHMHVVNSNICSGTLSALDLERIRSQYRDQRATAGQCSNQPEQEIPNQTAPLGSDACRNQHVADQKRPKIWHQGQPNGT